MRILLLGGSGFIGSHLADKLLSSGHTVSIYHAPGANCQNIAHIKSDVRIFEGDFNEENFSLLLEEVDVVVHLINSTIPGNSLNSPIYDLQSNVVGTLRLLDACRSSDVAKVVFLSSGGTVYGIPRYTPIDEQHPLNPISPYGISKVVIEKYLAMYHYQYGLDYTILRLSNPYGLRQDPYRGQGVLAAWMNHLVRGEPIEIWGDGSIVRDYVYVEDAVRAIERASTVAMEDKVFNVGSGVGHSLMDLKKKLERLSGVEVSINYKTMQKVDVPVNVLDVNRINQVLKWQSTIDIDQGIALMWKRFVEINYR